MGWAALLKVLSLLVCGEKVFVSAFVVGHHKTPISRLKPPPWDLQSLTDDSEVPFPRKVGPNLTFPDKLSRSLDLIPLVEAVSRHAATWRGRIGLLTLVDGLERTSDRRTRMNAVMGPSGSRRKTLGAAASVSLHFGEANENSTVTRNPPNPIDIVRISLSASEARQEYELIRQATVALQTGDTAKYLSKDAKDANHMKFDIPPIYGASSSPWDIGVVETDDDEWLPAALTGYGSLIELENILQADQVVKRLLETKNWANDTPTKLLAPGLSEIANSIDREVLATLHSEIADTVEVIRMRSVSDPTGSRTYSFRLSVKKFPTLRLLRQKESEMMREMDRSMQEFLQSDFARNGEAFDFNGRLVVSVPRRVAASVGIIRGFSRKGSMCYVEPKAIVERGDELAEIQADIAAIEKEIVQHISSAIIHTAPFIESGLNVIARIDAIFARAAYGVTMNGVIPHVGNEGKIRINGFVHPVLAQKEMKRFEESKNVVPIDMNISGKSGCQSLIISGPNGGGKTVALKSFGLAAAMCKVGIPIPINSRSQGLQDARIDFFNDIFVEVGDQQSVSEGESTLMARLNACAQVIQRVSLAGTSASECFTENKSELYSLVLLDELGSGTDPEAGSALSRAILEKIMESQTVRIVATTHLPQLKALSFNDDRFNCATVLLDASNESFGMYKLPTFKLAYGSIGDSYALGAASRCKPSLPDDVLQKAADILAGGEGGSGDMVRAIGLSLEREREAARISAQAAEEIRKDMLRCRGAIVSLARAYEEHLLRLENRLDTIFTDLREDQSKDAYDLVGETLAELRHVKKRVKCEQEILAERGLKMVPADYTFKDGENVVIIAKGEWEGQTATVSIGEKPSSTEGEDSNNIFVMPTYDWGGSLIENSVGAIDPIQAHPLKLKRSEIALWDYPSENSWDSGFDGKVRSIPDSKQKLFDVLSSLKSSDVQTKGDNMKTASSANSYLSSRERRAATAAAKKDKKRAKKKKKKR